MEQQVINRILNSSSYMNTGVVTTTYADDGLVAGNGYVLEKTFPIGIGITLNILIDYSTYIETEEWQRGLVYVYPPSFTSTAGIVNVNVYRGTDYAGGDEFDCINPNTTVANTTSGTTFSQGATGTDKGDVVLEYVVGTESSRQYSGGGTTQGATFFIRKNTDKTLVEVVNNSGEAITFHYGQVIYEI